MKNKLVSFRVFTVVSVPDDMEKIDIIDKAAKKVFDKEYIKDGLACIDYKIRDL